MYCEIEISPATCLSFISFPWCFLGRSGRDLYSYSEIRVMFAPVSIITSVLGPCGSLRLILQTTFLLPRKLVPGGLDLYGLSSIRLGIA